MADTPFQHGMTRDQLRAELNALHSQVQRLQTEIASLAESGTQGGGGPVRLIAVGNIGDSSGGGKYTGQIYTGCAGVPILDASNLSLFEGLVANGDGTSDVIVLNPDEDALPTHQLKADQKTWGLHIGYCSDSGDNRPVVILPWGKPQTAGPSTVGAASEGAEAADSKAWERDAATAGDTYGDSPVEVFVASRVGYFEAGNKTLYAYIRKLTFDASGRLFKVSTETRVTVDAAVDCTA